MNWKSTILMALAGGAILSMVAVGWGQGQKAKAPEPIRLIGSIEGPALYKAYCAVCHGTDAKGVGPMAIMLKKPPSDLTRIAAGNGGIFPAARLTRVISGEDQIAAGHGTREMPIWGPIFSHVDRDQDFGRVRVDNLVKYLQTLQGK